LGKDELGELRSHVLFKDEEERDIKELGEGGKMGYTDRQE
jgi:hypothetical protein